MSPLDTIDQDADSSTGPEPPTTEGRKVVDKDALQAQFSGYEVVDHAHVRLTPVVLRDSTSVRAQTSTLSRGAARRLGRRS